MEQQNYANRKSRVAFQEADGRVSGWLSVGQITVFGPGRKEPYRLGPGHLIIVSDKNGDLRQAIFVLRDQVSGWAARLYWYFLTLVLGAGLGRLYASLL